MDKIFFALIGIAFIVFGITCLLFSTLLQWSIMDLPGIFFPFVGAGIIVYSVKLYIKENSKYI
ncbi:hypothetical protein acsn021_19050 [Anaerocolumna cellulosilytica]|uniref:Uncharacterized protein n=1 Tax=Anaerocolumna cellulosilytica TaxID=433286 RepID=A0A6S6QX85_9FIRM|nr:putative ferric reductase [Anaerocolumna cellulosilytica]BCJ94336.1 hypothetical protein acsn021_19050 [Anaerocolumna cellulosilytica]